MSIAVSVLVGPARTGRLLLAACALVQCVTALALASWLPGTPWLALPSVLAATALFVEALRRPKPHRIDISGIGELRVTVQQGLRLAPAAQLLPGSVVWPGLMMLRWHEPGARVRTLLVWRDAVDVTAWRALAVALVAVARRARANEKIQ